MLPSHIQMKRDLETVARLENQDLLEQLEQLELQREALAAERRERKAARDAARRARRRSRRHHATAEPPLQPEFEPQERAAVDPLFAAPRVLGREGPAAPAA